MQKRTTGTQPVIFGKNKPKESQKNKQIDRAVMKAVHEYKASFKRLAAE